MPHEIEVLIVALVCAVAHLLSPLAFRAQEKARVAVASFSGGMAVAYVFLHLLPELSAGHEVVGRRIYGVALIGFLTFYASELLISRRAAASPGRADYFVHMVFTFVYSFLLVFTLGEQLPSTPVLTVIFSAVLGIHLMSEDFALQEAYAARFVRRGRFVLVGAVFAGYALSLIREPREFNIDIVTAVLCGFIMYIVFREELPNLRVAKFRLFLAGIVVFALAHIIIARAQ